MPAVKIPAVYNAAPRKPIDIFCHKRQAIVLSPFVRTTVLCQQQIQLMRVVRSPGYFCVLSIHAKGRGGGVQPKINVETAIVQGYLVRRVPLEQLYVQ